MTEDYESAFIRANANAEFIGHQLADLARRLMRASINNDGSQKYEAMNTLQYILKLASQAEGVRVYDVIDKAVSDLVVEREWGSYEADNLQIAKDATRYLLDMSSNDGFASGRASKRWRDVEASIKMRDEMREYRRQERLKEEKAARGVQPKKRPNK